MNTGPDSPTVPHKLVRRILVVDDNRDAADSLATLLRLIGHEVTVAYSGPASLMTAESFQPDVVFLDIGMPVMNGYEVARRMRETLSSQRCALVAVTGFGQLADRQKTEAAGFDNHVVKPASLDELLGILG